MPLISYRFFNRVLFFTGLLAAQLLSSGCVTQYRLDLENRETELLAREHTLQQQQTTLDQQQTQLELKLAQLEAQRKEIAAAKAHLEQEQRKLEVLTQSLNDQLNEAVIEAAKDAQPESPAEVARTEALVVGQLEKIYLQPPGLTLVARIDTGARTSSLNAINLTEFERDGKDYVSFQIEHPETAKPVDITRQIIKHRKIKNYDGSLQVRPVVKVRVVLGDIDQRVEVTLVDRSFFKYQMLVGRNFLNDFAIVDVSRKFITIPAATQ